MFGSIFLFFVGLAIFHWLFDHFFEKDGKIKKMPIIWMLIYLAICGILKNRLTIFLSKQVDKFSFLEQMVIQKDYKSQKQCYNNLIMKYMRGTIYLESFPDEETKFKEKFIDTIKIK